MNENEEEDEFEEPEQDDEIGNMNQMNEDEDILGLDELNEQKRIMMKQLSVKVRLQKKRSSDEIIKNLILNKPQQVSVEISLRFLVKYLTTVENQLKCKALDIMEKDLKFSKENCSKLLKLLEMQRGRMLVQQDLQKI
ncbi:MAG: hypothetical protein EZS28_000938 [Streblomastix strix]|uniref:Uncharacterized protein n=1 Tax=Streblomastix strix TaxID=222440 RepID=A0A5J4XAK5_9EUKA|nr:MAG: hypothetical protein EZS28_000938 [Streblomastix strix]